MKPEWARFGASWWPWSRSHCGPAWGSGEDGSDFPEIGPPAFPPLPTAIFAPCALVTFVCADFFHRKLRERSATVRAAQPGEEESRRSTTEDLQDSGAHTVSELLTSSGCLASVRRARRCRTSRGTTSSRPEASGFARWLGATRLSLGTLRSRPRYRAIRIPW